MSLFCANEKTSVSMNLSQEISQYAFERMFFGGVKHRDTL